MKYLNYIRLILVSAVFICSTAEAAQTSLFPRVSHKKTDGAQETTVELSRTVSIVCANTPDEKSKNNKSHVVFSGGWNPYSSLNVQIGGAWLSESPAFLLAGRCDHPRHTVADIFWKSQDDMLVHGRFVDAGEDHKFFCRFDVTPKAKADALPGIKIKFFCLPGIKYPYMAPHENVVNTPSESIVAYRGICNDQGWKGGTDKAFMNKDVILDPAICNPLVACRENFLFVFSPYMSDSAFSGCALAYQPELFKAITSPPEWASIILEFELKPRQAHASFLLWTYDGMTPRRAREALSLQMRRVMAFLDDPLWAETSPGQVIDLPRVGKELNELLACDIDIPPETRSEIKELLGSTARLVAENPKVDSSETLCQLYQRRDALAAFKVRLCGLFLDEMKKGRIPQISHERP